MEDIGYTNITFNTWKDFSNIFGVGFLETTIKNIDKDVILQTSITGDFLLKVELFSSESEEDIIYKYETLNSIFTLGEITYDNECIYITYPISKNKFKNNLLLAKKEIFGLRTFIQLNFKEEEREHIDMAAIQEMVDKE